MEVFLITLIIFAFASMLFLNVYFRIRVLKHYKVLVRNGVEFNTSHIFNRQKMEEEIVPHYPGFEKHLHGFSSNLRRTIRMATVLIVLITLFGAVLMYYRD